MRKTTMLLLFAAIAGISGCTVHPRGESRQRLQATRAGALFAQPPSKRSIPPLPQNPTRDDLVRYALRSSPQLEQRYWEWVSAIEQIPQDGTAGTTLAINGAMGITRGQVDLADTVLTAQNMPSMMIPWPGKLSAAAHRALENAQAAGLRFRQAQFDLRQKVLDAWDDYALSAELIRLQQRDRTLLETIISVIQARLRAGSGSQSDLLKVRNELDLSRNQIEHLQSRLATQRTELNALLNRSTDAPLAAPDALGTIHPLNESDAQLLARAARSNPDLRALAHEVAANGTSVELARLQYFPDFAAGVSSDLAGITQQLMGMVSAPFLRHDAIEASIRQAQAQLHAAQAQLRQSRVDLGARLLVDLASLHDLDRQIDLLNHTIVPRAQQVVSLSRAEYETGRKSALDLLDSQRSLIALQKMAARLHRARQGARVDIEAAAAIALPNQDAAD